MWTILILFVGIGVSLRDDNETLFWITILIAMAVNTI